MTTLYTIGHSNRSLEAFLAVLSGAGIAALVDVRARPRSGRYPHFNEHGLRQALAARGIDYHWAGRQLGGMRDSRPASRHEALAESGMRAYADYMQTQAFQCAVDQLTTLGERVSTAIMCAEREPLACHRSLISDYLTLHGVQVVHLIDVDDQRDHRLRSELRRGSADLVYDRHAQGELGL